MLLPLILILSCFERERLNPFDSEGNVQSPVDLVIQSEGHSAHLSWTVKNISDYRGFRLYRSEDNQPSILYREFTASVSSFTDSSLAYYRWYQYRMSVLGYEQESPLSKAVRIYPGPGKIWILTRYGYSIKELPYDLQQINNIFNINYPPINWDWDLVNRYIWLAFAQYRYISRFDLSLGYEDLLIQDDFQRPQDIQWDHNLQQVVVLDPDKQAIYFLEQGAVIDSISLGQGDFFRIRVFRSSQLAALRDSAALIFDASRNATDTLNFPPGFLGQDICFGEGMLYLLSSNLEGRESEIIRYQVEQHTEERMTITGAFRQIRKPVAREYYCLGEILDANSCRVVKLSADGQRLLELPVLTGTVDDLQINPYDHSIIVVQRYQDNVVLYDSTGVKISDNTQIYDPIKAFIE